MLTLSEGCSKLWLVQSEKTFHLKINLSLVSHSFVLNSVLVGLAWQCKLIHLFTKKHSGGFPSRWTKNPVLLEQSEYENFWSLPDNLCNPSFESHSAWDESVLWWRIKALSALVGLMISFSISRCLILLHTKLWTCDSILDTLLFESSRTVQDMAALQKGDLEKEKLRF